jgi:hypothetical protein
MMELCPDDEEASCFFIFFFLQRLPAWLRVQLEGNDQDNIMRMATRVDRQFALHGHKHGGSVAVVEDQEEEDAGLSSTQSRGAVSVVLRSAGLPAKLPARRAAWRPEGLLQGSQGGNQQQGRSGTKPMTPSEAAAAAAAGICWNHWRFTEKASSFRGSAATPCNWQEN